MESNLSLHEKRPLAFMGIDIIVFALFHFFLFRMFDSSINKAIEDVSIWAIAILSLIPIMIVGRILLYLLFSLINTLVTNKREDKFQKDELGKIIRLKSNQIFSNVILLGFLISISTLLINMPLSSMFNGFLLSIYAAFIIKNLSEFYFLRKGTSI